MSETVIVAFIAAVIPAAAAITVQMISNSRAGKKLDHITVLTNSTLTAANQRIEQLEDIVNQLVNEREARDRGTLPVPASPAASVDSNNLPVPASPSATSKP